MTSRVKVRSQHPSAYLGCLLRVSDLFWRLHSSTPKWHTFLDDVMSQSELTTLYEAKKSYLSVSEQVIFEKICLSKHLSTDVTEKSGTVAADVRRADQQVLVQRYRVRVGLQYLRNKIYKLHFLAEK